MLIHHFLAVDSQTKTQFTLFSGNADSRHCLHFSNSIGTAYLGINVYRRNVDNGDYLSSLLVVSNLCSRKQNCKHEVQSILW